MIEKTIVRIVVFLIFGALMLWLYRQRLARKRFVATVKTMAENDQIEIDGQSVEHWLNILNQDENQTLLANDTVVLKYKGREFFFVNGEISYLYYDLKNTSSKRMKSCFLIAVDRSAVWLLSDQEQVFRLIAGSTDLAAFSIYRWSDFVVALMSEKQIAEIKGSEGNSSGQT